MTSSIFTPQKLRSHLDIVKQNRVKTLKESIDPEIVTSTLKELKIDYRERVFTPFVTLYAMLSQPLSDDGSCRHAVLDVLALRMARGLKPCSSATGGFCSAKARLPVSFFAAISRKLVKTIDNRQVSTPDWPYGAVKVVDGTGIVMPDTKNNLVSFHRHHNDHKKVGFAHGRLSAVFSLATGCLLDFVTADHLGQGSGESNLLRQLWHCFGPGDTLLGDSVYSNYWVLNRAQKEGVYVVAEFPRKQWKRIHTSKDEQTIVIQKPVQRQNIDPHEYETAVENITARIVKIKCAPKGFRAREKFILTTHLDPQRIPAEKIAGLYGRRWSAEIYLRSIKTTLGMDMLKARSPELVLKEIWGYMLAYNLLRLVMAQAGVKYHIAPSQFSFRACQQIIRIVRVFNLNGVFALDLVYDLLLANVIIFRPGRFEPRAQKRRHKNYAFLQQPRNIARQVLYKKYKGRKPMT